MTVPGLGRFGEPALWILVALHDRALAARPLLAAIQGLDGAVGPGTFIGALARTERLGMVRRIVTADGGEAYRLVDPPAPLASRETMAR